MGKEATFTNHAWPERLRRPLEFLLALEIAVVLACVCWYVVTWPDTVKRCHNYVQEKIAKAAEQVIRVGERARAHEYLATGDTYSAAKLYDEWADERDVETLFRMLETEPNYGTRDHILCALGRVTGWPGFAKGLTEDDPCETWRPLVPRWRAWWQAKRSGPAR